MNKRKDLFTQFYNRNQSWHYEVVASFQNFDPPVVLRVYIERNAYDHQSSQKGEALSTDPNSPQWNRILSKPITGARCKVASYVRKDENVLPFEQDADDLFGEMLTIIKAARGG